MTSTPDPLLEQLRLRRIELGMTQATLARRSGFSPPEISKWERGERTISLWKYEVLVNTLGCSVELVPNNPEKNEDEES